MTRTRALALCAGLAAAVPPLWAATPAPPPRPVVTGPMAPDTLVAALKAEQSALLRRLDVCTELRKVADQTNDAKLRERADALEAKANEVYHLRTGRLGLKPPGAGDAPTAAAFREVRP